VKDNLKTKARLIQELEQLRDRINKLQTAGNSNSDRKEPSDKSHLNQIEVADSEKTEEALAYKAMMLDNILRTATDVAIATTDMNLVITYYNPVAEHFFGYTAEEVIGKTVMEIHMKENVSPDRLERAIDIVRQTGEYKYSLVQETDNGPRYLNSRVSSILNSDGDMVGFCLFSRDVTEKVLSDQILKESTERHRSLVESTADWVWATDLQGSHTFSNGSIKALLGYEVNEILGESAFPLMHPDDLQSSRELVASAVKHKRGWSNVEIRWLHKDGSVRVFESSARPLFDINGEMTGFSGIDRDITEYKKAQEALRKSEFDMRTLFNAMTDIVFEMDYDGTYINIAPTSPELMFLAAEDLIGKTLHQVFPKAEADQFLSFIRRCIDENETISIEYPMVIGKRTVWFEGRATPKTKNTVLYIATDITKKKLSEDALRESEERLRALINAMPDIVCFKDGQGRWLEANESDIRLFQLDGVDFRGKKDSELAEFTPFYSDAFNTCEETDEHAWEAGCITRSEEVIRRPDDSPVVLDVIKVPTFYADGQRKGLVVVGRDITLRKNAEAERVRLMMAIEQAAETIVITDPQGIIEYLNPAFEKVTGYSRDEVIGQNPSMLASGEHDLAFYQDMWETLTRGENWAGRIINKKKDGSFYTEEATISPVRDPSGDVINYVAVKHDITTELKLEEQLRQAQKMEAVGQLAGGVAHDFNNILQVINGYTQLTLAEINKEHSAYEFVREIAKAGDRAQSLVSQLLSFSRRQIINPVDLDLNEVTEKLMKMIRRVIGEHIHCEFIPGHELGTIQADSGQMEQILMNLCVNSRDALAGGGNISIETGNVLIDAEYAAKHPWAKPGRYVLLSVTDDGCGMDKKTLAGIFDPFFTTKSVGKGTGLGMSTVYGIVKQHKGEIQVYSEPGRGTVVKIYLPVVARRAADVASQVDASVTGGAETILVAEDDNAVRNLTRQTLVTAGYTVIDAKNGNDAVSLFHKHADKINLLMLDVVMPGLGGKEVYDRIHETHPDVPALFCSGYSRNAIHTGFVLDSDLNFIQKPYGSDSLLRKIRQVLDS